ncbi:hypothetical protein AB434_1667 [Heyndrickxia coagulans]|uniref:Uncharacterized protein n=1 Tax=Heyndrickxia coagulans TaxID=1398 RepID=A0AAN0WDT9_HEYCO|nr:hypothetical protein SB48_HM08orf05829 [Heyndrickxia coagulans]AKN54072.1 hypothetical protein AB434_1667 [Heyndrickxia coagulans]
MTRYDSSRQNQQYFHGNTHIKKPEYRNPGFTSIYLKMCGDCG